jgi:hypothetical protein
MTKAHIPALDGMRFVAAMMVVVGHSSDSITLFHPKVSEFLAPLAPLAMAVFFVLSGFVMWLNYADDIAKDGPAAVRRFAVARIARLCPMYLIALVLAAIVTDPHTLRSIFPGALTFLIGVQAWFPSYDGTLLPMLFYRAGHLWSISIEFFLYMLFPMLVALMGAALSFNRAILYSFLNAGAALLAYTLLYHRPAEFAAAAARTLSINDAMSWLSYYSPYLHIFEFVAGCLACAAFLEYRESNILLLERQRSQLAAVFSIIIMAIVLVLFARDQHLGQWYVRATVFIRWAPIPALAFLTFFVSRYERSFLSRFLSSRLAVYGGEASYSIYLLHPFILGWIVPANRTTPPITLTVYFSVLATICLITLVISRFTYAAVEVPARRWLRKFLSRA